MIDLAHPQLPILNLDASTSWNDVLQFAMPHLEQRGLQRLKDALAERTRSVIIERFYIDKDYRDTFSHFHSKRFSTPDSRCVRLHFFKNHVTRERLRDTVQLQPDYLGYSVIRPTRPNCLGRTMLSPNSRSTVDGNIAVCRERVTVEGTELEIEGFPFISQDADVTVCAQAALWMLVRYFSNRFPHYPETYPVQIGNLTRDYSIGRMFPSSGLYVWQMAEALRQLGFSPLIYERQEFKSFFEHYLYTYVESGIPVLAALDKHVVVLFGHRSDYTGAQQLVPESGMQHFFSSQLNRSFLGHDDNGIPYQMLSHFPSVVSDSMRAAIGSVKSFVVPLAEKVFLPAESFQTVALALLSRADVGIRMSASLSRATLLLRLFLTTGRSFKQRLGERGMGSELAEDVYRATPLPHFVWICELSDPSLYPNSVLGEIVWDATRNVYEPDGWIAVHYPEVLIVDTGSPLNLPENLMRFPILDGQPYPIYRNNLRSVP